MSAIARFRAIARLRFHHHRPFGSAAALQYNYDDDEEEFEQNSPRGMLDTEGSAPERGVQWVMIGEPGAKRHLFAVRLSKLLEVPYISMASLLHQELNPRSSLYQQIANALDHGKLVPEKIIFALLSKRLEDGYYRGETGFILDGIPRTKIQADILNQIAHVDLVVNFKCPQEDIVEKKLGLHKFTAGQEHIFTTSSWTATKQLQDQYIHKRAEESKLLEDYYRRQKKLLNFEVAGGAGETWKGLLAALHLQHISSSQKLTA
ncbi:unnamed protein product [Vicia faba]|uniref:adenylate kinase n=1 Tax=Vicia faba TaxID=3906 RepID=A0AAV1ANT1_VICFA|nr:unnamed protein product [Vicia faba]